MSILFINGSPNKNGNTVALAQTLLKGKEYETLNLTEYKVYSYGHKFKDDQLSEIISKMKEADTIVIGSPLYWHNICGAVRNVLDRFYGLVQQNELSGKKMYFLFQGAAPEKWMMEAGEYTVIMGESGSGKTTLLKISAGLLTPTAGLYGMTYMGMATDRSEAQKMSEKL